MRFATWVLLLVLVVASGLQVARTSQEVRSLHVLREQAQQEQDEHLAEYSRLLIERAALAAYQNVERMARDELDMSFPEDVERIEP
ncbi:MAG: cell division protein FtsL [Gammaproteobacteria bacterium]|nr:cell division protein FtsL [Gammaproteobacteria bacterium]